ncbi:MAG: amidohydrolase family protein, partial [Phycisphaerales bacterium]
ATVVDVPKGSMTPGLIDANAMVEARDLVSTRGARGSIGEAPREAPQSQGPSALALMFHDHRRNEDCFACSGAEPCALANMHETLEPGQICPCCGFPTYQDVENLISGVNTQEWSQTEASSEVVPHTRVIDSVNLRSADFDRLARAGVTTVFVSPDSSAVIGPRGAIVRTAGSMRDRVVSLESDVKAAMGSDPYSVGTRNSPPFRGFVSSRTRRPNTRMGVTWVFRKALFDTQEWARGETPSGADTPPAEALPVLKDLMDGKVRLRVHARQQSDILTAIRLAGEQKLSFTLLEGTEAYKCLNELKAAEVPVIFGPLYMTPSGARQRSSETDGARLTTLKELLDAGIPTALSAQDLREEDGLARQAMYAMKSGVSREEAIRAITLTPATMLGIADVTGSVETGKRADLVVWNGEALDATAQPVVVMVGGKVVFDGRGDQGRGSRRE